MHSKHKILLGQYLYASRKSCNSDNLVTWVRLISILIRSVEPLVEPDQSIRSNRPRFRQQSCGQGVRVVYQNPVEGINHRSKVIPTTQAFDVPLTTPLPVHTTISGETSIHPSANNTARGWRVNQLQNYRR